MDGIQELQEELQRLTQTVAEMRSRMAKLEGRGSSTDSELKRSDRRGFLKLGAGAALGALGWAAVKAVPASAADGGNLVLGSANLAESATSLTGDTSYPIPVFSAAAQGTNWVNGTTGTFTGPLQGLGTADAHGVEGWASGTITGGAAGVYGLTDGGVGVVGESSTGIGLYARASGRILQDGLPLAGAPTYIPNLYEQVRDLEGVLWIHDGGGDWRRVNTLRVDTADGLGAPFKPFRLLDTRLSGPIKAKGSVTSVDVHTVVSGASTLPLGTIAVVGNLTAVDYTGSGFLAIMPDGILIGTNPGDYNPASDPSSVNFILGQKAIANAFVCGLSFGVLQVYVAGHSSHFIIDITAYIQ
jgi:hypothetical protein